LKHKYTAIRWRNYMPSLTCYALQKEIYEKLIESSLLMSLVNGVFDYPPQGISFPFINIGNIIVSDLSSLGSAGNEYQLDIHIWSREAGHKQVADIMEIIYGLLHNGSIAITDKELIIMKFISNSLQLEDDGFTYQGTMRLMVVLSDIVV
jgi:hypothetical protein